MSRRVSHWAESFELYSRSLQRFAQWRTLWHILVDVGLAALLALFIFLFSVLSLLIFTPFREAVNLDAVEQGQLPAEAVTAMLAAAGLSPGMLVYRLVALGLLLIVVYTAIYALSKLVLWESVLERRLTWKRRLRFILWAELGVLALVLLVYAAIKLHAFIGAAMLLAALFFIIFIHPYCTARAIAARKPRRFAARFWTMVLFATITFVGLSYLLGFITQRLITVSSYFVLLLVLYLFVFLAWARAYVATVLEVRR